MDDLDDFVMRRVPTANRPLLGMTVLVVEDSRYACEAIRLLCLRSGARIRRADSLRSARKHLRVYRPSVVIVDMGLPDGSGAGLIEELAAGTPRIPVILGISGDDNGAELAEQAGADGFMAKPVGALAVFQDAVLRHLPRDAMPAGPRAVSQEHVIPDEIALRDDLAHVADILEAREDDASLDYVAQFLGGIARSAGDFPLGDAARALSDVRRSGTCVKAQVGRISSMLEARLAQTGIV